MNMWQRILTVTIWVFVAVVLFGLWARYAYGAETCPVDRDAHGRIARSKTVVHAFQRAHPCPATGLRFGSCPGYVVDHVKPLCAGGCDAVENMQWQTVSDAKAKDKLERAMCGKGVK